MSDFQRYAVYYLPDDADLASFGASWLGWDVARGTRCDHPDARGVERFTETPRNYGFHGTLKPPFRLAEDTTFDGLARSVADLAGRHRAIRLDGLRLARIGQFLALVPEGDTTALNRLAFSAITELDRFRSPPSDVELARRRSAGLTPKQDALLVQWGYPYVAEEFRFHLTLTGKLDTDDLEAARQVLATRLPHLPNPFVIGSIALVGEDAEGMFHLIHRYALTG